jgi:hypothetical protein
MELPEIHLYRSSVLHQTFSLLTKKITMQRNNSINRYKKIMKESIVHSFV